ncbi:uncharacterized protein PFL1_05439 [Pseudozyma flocculosa PF-1]|uniref:TFIIB-type domain-containing protein n=2 Tax=Pseudozyma flocculosa TaxID=84751 RepID=A0A5C3FCR2_9BASI|nr:uncharacterized protein PFL1_05439 [Pseudozyma flocculosa PF-1]EPQ27158.1 hypothetical protein PFL1_05439 [Pseudozyma flocculosa PF-1]SPO41261.1 uncharacterized protein PSFLO_06743 [Pseudozyma flocculosa]
MDDSPTCPSCGAVGSIQYITQILTTACDRCGYVDDSAQFYGSEFNEPENYDRPAAPVSANVSGGGGEASGYTLVSRPGEATPVSSNAFRHLSAGYGLLRTELTSEESRIIADRRHRPAITRLILGTLTRVGHPNFAARANTLFHQAKAAALQRSNAVKAAAAAEAVEAGEDASTALGTTALAGGKFDGSIRWGSVSDCMAAACCYAVLRREGRIIDLETVAGAAMQPLPGVQRSLRHLKILAGHNLRDVGFRHVDVTIVRILDFFDDEMRRTGGSALQPAVRKFLGAFELQRRPLGGVEAATSSSAKSSVVRAGPATSKRPRFDDVKELALDLGNLWWRRRPPGVSPIHAAYATAVLAMEAAVKRSVTLEMMVPYASVACEGPRVEDELPVGGCRTDGAGDVSLEDGKRHTAIKARYQELLSLLEEWSSRLPWIAAAPPITTPARRRSATPKKRGSAGAPATRASETRSLSRDELICHAADIISFASQQADQEADGVEPIAKRAKRQGAAAGQRQCKGEEGREQGELDDSEVYLDVELPREEAKTGDGSEVGQPSPPRAAIDVAPKRVRGALAHLEPLMVSLERLERAQRSEASAGSSASSRIKDEAAATTGGSGGASGGGGGDYASVRERIEAATGIEGQGAGAVHPIDALSNEQVDELLFTERELASLLRTRDEVEAVARMHQRLRDWDDDDGRRGGGQGPGAPATRAAKRNGPTTKRTRALGVFERGDGGGGGEVDGGPGRAKRTAESSMSGDGGDDQVGDGGIRSGTVLADGAAARRVVVAPMIDLDEQQEGSDWSDDDDGDSDGDGDVERGGC